MCLYWRERGTLLRKVYGRISTDSLQHRMLPGEGATAITRISGGSFDLSIPGYGTIIEAVVCTICTTSRSVLHWLNGQPHWTGYEWSTTKVNGGNLERKQVGL